ncbi:hypothetical protein [Nitrososphaera sp.]|uniref:hypothetical protein n=1 Tax=Nitrososphaera sp. TaxID=1971748 RepID=UPI00307DA91C
MMIDASDTETVRKRLYATILVAAAGMGLLMLFAGEVGQERPFVTNWTINVTASAAAALAVLVSVRQGTRGLYGSAHAALAAGLVLWLTAELLWTHYELGLGISTPFPSAADALWLAGYPLIAYHLVRVYRFFGRGRPALAAGLAIAYSAFVAYLSLAVATTTAATVSAEDVQGGGAGDVMRLAVSVAYPVLDGVLAVPAILVLANLKGGRFTSTPWALLSSALLLVALADSGFAYHAAAGLEGQIWVWDIFFNASYVAIAATLFWHHRFFIFDKNKLKKMWQWENR